MYRASVIPTRRQVPRTTHAATTEVQDEYPPAKLDRPTERQTDRKQPTPVASRRQALLSIVDAASHPLIKSTVHSPSASTLARSPLLRRRRGELDFGQLITPQPLSTLASTPSSVIRPPPQSSAPPVLSFDNTTYYRPHLSHALRAHTRQLVDISHSSLLHCSKHRT